MNNSAVIITTILLAIGAVLLYVYYRKTDKERTVRQIQMVYDGVDKLMGYFVHQETEEVVRKQINQLLLYAEKKGYSFDAIKEFRIFSDNLHCKIKKNNTDVVDRMLMEPVARFKQMTDASYFITSRQAPEIAKDFDKSTAFSDVTYTEIAALQSDLVDEFKNIRARKKELIAHANDVYIENEKARCKALFDNIDGKSLDDNQRNAVVNDDDRQLVVAGAGCGKTLTMAAKVDYLIEKNGLNKADVLLLSFTRKAAEEMQDRLGRIGIDMESFTFHKLGLDIISKVQGKKPDVYDDIRSCLNDYYKEVLSTNKKAARNFLNLVGLMLLPNYDQDASQGERMLADKSWDFTTLKNMFWSSDNERLRSRLADDLRELREEKRAFDATSEYETAFITKFIETVQRIAADDELSKTAIDSIKKRLQGKSDNNPLSTEDPIIRDISDLVVSLIRSKEYERTSLRNELLKSREEVKIANYLFLHGINYEYEAEYPFDEKDNYRKRYRPDFYLPDDDVYIEHFGINKNGRAPHLSAKNEKEYLAGMRWKRSLHREKGTKLIETYSWQFQNGSIEDYLNEKIRELNIKTKELDYGEVIDKLFRSDEYHNSINSVATLITTFIALFKSNNYDAEKFNELLKSCGDRKKDEKERAQMERNIAFLRVAKSFYRYYSEFLEKNSYIDFNDMINLATSYVASDAYSPDYKYVIVDEYQDISMGRFYLIDEILKKTGAKLFCVGDDWQSIYKFTGSEVSLFTDFLDYFGPYSRIDIVRTYRNTQELLRVAGSFVMRNGAQLKKELISNRHDSYPVNIVYYSLLDNILEETGSKQGNNPGELIDKSVRSITSALEKAIDAIHNSKEYYGNDILLLGRNNSDIDSLEFGGKLHKSLRDGRVIITHDDYPQMFMEYLTIHRAKGLESDNVIILNLFNSIAGFPNQMTDDPVLDLLHRDEKESYAYAEERRLMYVALTRSRNRVFLISPDVNYSTFVDELKIMPNVYQSGAESIHNAVTCPNCNTGYLVVRRNSAGKDFVGCTNFPMCRFTAPDPKVIANGQRCPRCNGFLIEKYGKHGRFYGCTNYPYCNYTKDIEVGHYSKNKGNQGKSGTAKVRKNKPEGKKWFKYEDQELNNLLKSIKCPECKTGHLALRYWPGGGGFFGCSNYPECNFVAKDPQAVLDDRRCPKCGTYMVKRFLYSDNKEFYGCSNYPKCSYKEKIDGTPFTRWSELTGKKW